jgi:hypothetical protein
MNTRISIQTEKHPHICASLSHQQNRQEYQLYGMTGIEDLATIGTITFLWFFEDAALTISAHQYLEVIAMQAFRL